MSTTPANPPANPPRNPNIIWLAGYPRSGQTWLRFLVANLLVRDITSSLQVADVIPQLDASGGRRLALPPDHRSLVATRWPHNPDNDLFGLTAGFIYVVRNPRDVMRSLFDFNLTEYLPEGAAADAAARAAAWARYVDAFIDHRGHPVPGGDAGVADWIGHVESWRRAAETVPGLFVRYEDLLTDTGKQMERICAFLRAAPDAAVVDGAMAKSSFAALQTMQDAEVAARTPGLFYAKALDALVDKGIRVLGHGTMGDTVLPAAQAAAFDGVFGDAMAALGYAIDPDGGQLTVAETALGPAAELPPGPDLAAARIGVITRRPAPPADPAAS